MWHENENRYDPVSDAIKFPRYSSLTRLSPAPMNNTRLSLTLTMPNDTVVVVTVAHRLHFPRHWHSCSRTRLQRSSPSHVYSNNPRRSSSTNSKYPHRTVTRTASRAHDAMRMTI